MEPEDLEVEEEEEGVPPWFTGRSGYDLDGRPYHTALRGNEL